MIPEAACTNAIEIRIFYAERMFNIYPPSFWMHKYFPSQLNHFIQSQLNIAKLVEYVMAWQQDVKYVECRLEDFGQELVTQQTNIKVILN